MEYRCDVSKLFPRNGGVLGFRYKTPEGVWKEKSTGLKREREAKQFVRDFQHKMETGTMPNDMSSWRLLGAAERWQSENRENRIAESTKGSESYRYQHLPRILGNIKLSDITSRHLSKYQNARLGEGIGPDSINKEIRLWSLILKEAKLWRFLRDDYKPLKCQASEIGQALTRDQVQHLVKTAHAKDSWGVVLCVATIAANTGIRGGEIKKLHLSEIDLVGKQFHIKRYAVGSKSRKEGVKTDAGVRKVVLNEDALEGMKRLVERYEEICREANIQTSPTHYLLPQHMSRHTRGAFKGRRGYDPNHHQKDWGTAWNRLVDKAGFKTFRFHDLRHTFISHMVEHGKPMERIQAMVGHISSRMVRHYTHVATNVLHDDVAVLDAQPLLAGVDLFGEDGAVN